MADTWTERFKNPILWIAVVSIIGTIAVTLNNVDVLSNRLEKKIKIINELQHENDKQNIEIEKLKKDIEHLKK